MHEHSQILTLQTGLRRMLSLRCLLMLCMAMLASVATAQHTVRQTPPPLTLGWEIPMQRLNDPGEQWTPDEVLADTPPNTIWQPMDHALNAGYLQHVVWLRFKVPDADADTDGGPVWLLGTPTYLDSVVLYQRDEFNGVWRAQRSGDYVPARDKAPIRQHLFRLEPGKLALIRIQTTSAMQFRGEIFMNAQALGAQLAASERSMGLYFGAMTALLLAIWAAAGIFRTYNLYALAVLGTVSALHVFNVRGYGSLWAPESWTVWASHSVGVGAFVLAATVAWQVREQLTRNSQHRRADRVLCALVILNLMGTASVPLGFYPSVAWINLVSLVGSDIIAVSLCLNALRQRRAQHALLLTAYGIHLVGGIPTTAVMTGLARWNLDTTSIWQFQALIFTSLIACAVFVGMVLRYRQAEIGKDKAIERLAQSELALEDRIEQRTRELSLAQMWLKQALDSERDLRLEQRQFFDMISHEFRTPLAVVDSAAAEQQSFPTPDLTTQMDRAKQIRRACRRLTSLVDSCLISERLDSAGFTLHSAPANVASLLKHAAQLVHWSPRHQLHLFTESAPTEWICDQTLVRIALSNLVDNAVKYASEGEIFIAARKNDAGLLEISVADEGSGMSLEVMNRIFERFERGDRTDQSKGFGLGLWVARRVARLHSGDITVESKTGQGTRFTLTLAAQSMAAHTGARTSNPPPSATRRNEIGRFQDES